MDKDKAIDACSSIRASAQSIEDCLRSAAYIPEAFENLKRAIKDLEDALNETPH